MLNMPPYEICRLCFFRQSEVCPKCSYDGDCAEFELNPLAKLEHLTSFPIDEFNNGMPPHVRQVVVGVYLKLLIDYIGDKNERENIHPIRSITGLRDR